MRVLFFAVVLGLVAAVAAEQRTLQPGDPEWVNSFPIKPHFHPVGKKATEYSGDMSEPEYYPEAKSCCEDEDLPPIVEGEPSDKHADKFDKVVKSKTVVAPNVDEFLKKQQEDCSKMFKENLEKENQKVLEGCKKELKEKGEELVGMAGKYPVVYDGNTPNADDGDFHSGSKVVYDLDDDDDDDSEYMEYAKVPKWDEVEREQAQYMAETGEGVKFNGEEKTAGTSADSESITEEAAPAPVEVPAEKNADVSEWSYKDTSSWPGECTTGQQQSPIVVDTNVLKYDAGLFPLLFDYDLGKAKRVVNNGHFLAVTFPADTPNILRFSEEGTDYKLKKAIFHTPSEHTFNDLTFPMEMQLIHEGTNIRTGKKGKAAVSVFFEEGSEANPFLKALGKLPEEGDAELSEDVDVRDALPEKRQYVQYVGSMTTPPCQESVEWRVLINTVSASAKQIEGFKALFEGNVRPVMPLNDRLISTNMGESSL